MPNAVYVENGGTRTPFAALLDWRAAELRGDAEEPSRFIKSSSSSSSRPLVSTLYSPVSARDESECWQLLAGVRWRNHVP